MCNSAFVYFFKLFLLKVHNCSKHTGKTIFFSAHSRDERNLKGGGWGLKWVCANADTTPRLETFWFSRQPNGFCHIFLLSQAGSKCTGALHELGADFTGKLRFFPPKILGNANYINLIFAVLYTYKTAKLFIAQARQLLP